jgi:endonuclease/exonuclease/phosphatase family metal-dependent hydrolase
MASILDDPLPQAVLDDLASLRQRLALIPPKQDDDNLLIATWNIRMFGDLTESWTASQKDSPKRDFHAAVMIAEILSRFDVIAVQEVKSNLRALRHTLRKMGPDWGFLMTDVTYGDPGHTERLAFIYDTRRLKPSGLACELVVPEDLKSPYARPANAFQRQFVRTPYAVAFTTGDKTFVLVTLHVNYGEKGADRIAELTSIAEWLRNWAESMDDYGQNLICLGDFNIDRYGDPLWQAFTSTGLSAPVGLNNAPRTVFASGDGPSQFYDQIAWFDKLSNGKPYLSLEYRQCGYVDFKGAVMTQLTTRQLSDRISDHYPLWVEFGVT